MFTDLLLLIELDVLSNRFITNWKVKQVKTSFHSTERLKINLTFRFSSHVLCDITGNLDRNVRKYVLSSNMDNDY